MNLLIIVIKTNSRISKPLSCAVNRSLAFHDILITPLIPSPSSTVAVQEPDGMRMPDLALSIGEIFVHDPCQLVADLLVGSCVLVVVGS